MWLLVGLGNPGAEYEKTRHNIGFMVIDQLAKTWQLELKKKKFSSFYAYSPERETYLVKPQTFMNRSGLAVKKWVEHLNLPLTNLLVVLDDLDLPLGEIRLRFKGGSGGHHGLESIIEELKTSDFPRLRLGIGRPRVQGREADYVLSPFKKGEEKVLMEAIEKGLRLLEDFISEPVT